MKISELQKRVADVLGVSVSQKELSFEIFIDTISDILDHGITLKVPRVGFFQLKRTKLKDDSEKILFSPLPEDYSQDMRSLYLTIDLAPKSKNTLEFDSHIFSIGVGKPLLPLTSDELPDTETSYAMLKKSIEERVKELISESDQIPNFNIWDDYYKSQDDLENKNYNETQSRFNELTSDLEFKEISIPPGIPSSFFEDSTASKDSTQTKDYEKENLDDNYWPNFEENDLIDFDKIQSAKKQEADDQIIKISDEEEQQNSDEESPEEDNIDYSKIETGPDEESEDSSQTLANLLEDNPENDQVSEDEKTELDIQKSAVEGYFSGEEVKSLEQPEIVDSIVSKEQGTVENSGSEILTGEPEKVEEPKLEIESIETQENIIPLEVEKTDELDKPGVEKPAEEGGKQVEEGEKPILKDSEQEIPETKNSDDPDASHKFDELEKIIAEEKAESDLQDVGDDKELSSDEESKDDAFENNTERIEWNWGDELKEEFGISKNMFEDTGGEHFSGHDNLGDDLELIDEPLESDRRFTKDLFKELEKTLERDKLFDDFPPRKRPTVVEFPKNNDSKQKVFLEFSGPPTRYEFIEDRKVEREKRMAISLVEEDDNLFTTSTGHRQTSEKKSEDSEKYFGKTFLIIISAFIVVTLTIIFLFLRPNNKDVQQNTANTVQQKPADEIQTAQTEKNTVQQTQKKNERGGQTNNITTSQANDEISDFPISAIPPVPVRSGSGEQQLTPGNTSASNKDVNQPANKPTQKSTNTVSKGEPNETRIGKSIYTDGKTFNYQTSSWKNKQKAEQELKRLKGMGLNAYIVEVYLPQKGGTWYRVRVGSFKSQQEAENSMKQNNL